MPTFNFSVQKKRKTIENNNRNKIILRKVKGIIWINEKGIYSVAVKDENGIVTKYTIHPDCYTCKKHAQIYRRGVDFENRHVYIRVGGEYHDKNPNDYLPFDPGCVVIGNVVKTPININPVFVIKKCWVEFDNPQSHEAVLFYKKHINEINEIIKKTIR